jgi:hypothetical protein
MSTGAITAVFAFDPVDELAGEQGVLMLNPVLAARLVAEHRVELVEPHLAHALRFVAGSPAHEHARQALRDARASAAPTPARARKIAKLEQ